MVIAVRTLPSVRRTMLSIRNGDKQELEQMCNTLDAFKSLPPTYNPWRDQSKNLTSLW